jgi:hypothetical protein
MAEHGSLVNQLSGDAAVTPEVGMGATELGWTDRHAYTIVKVISPITIEVQRDTATRVDKNGMSECQKYEFTPNPIGKVVRLRKTKKGWCYKGQRFAIGYRDEYYDYSF